MLPKDFTLNGIKTITNCVNGVISTSYTSGPAWRSAVVASAIVKGNHRTPNPHSWSTLNAYYYTGSGSTYTDAKNWSRENGVYSGLGYPSSAVGSSNVAFNQALAKLYDKYRGNLDLSVDAGQLRQTKAMFNAIDVAERFVVRRASLIKKAGSAWLEYVYGWKPIIQNVYDIADNAARSPGGYLSETRAGARNQNDDFVKQKAPPYVYETMTSDFVGVKFCVTYATKGGFDVSKWTSLNPASIAWELMPYSFVVDWFYNVGGYMRSLESALISNKNFVSGYISILNRREVTRRRSINIVSGGVTYLEDLRATSRSVSFSRTILTAPPLPRSPTLRADLGASRLLSAASLLSQFLKR